MNHTTNTSSKVTVLFDLDGTLTPPRGMISERVINSLLVLNRFCEVGILSGSNYDYILEQIQPLIPLWNEKLHLLGRNGTQYHIYKGSSNNFVKKSSVSMREKCSNNYNELVENLQLLQLLMQKEFKIPLTGTFIQYRGSTVNWCPIGRSASKEDRELFSNMDKQYDIRNKYLRMLKSILIKNDIENISVTLGGETSFDIYPKGWDKTYALRFFNEVIFVGDRCQEGGNDFSICSHLKDKCFRTSGPDETCDIIKNILIPKIR